MRKRIYKVPVNTPRRLVYVTMTEKEYRAHCAQGRTLTVDQYNQLVKAGRT